MPRRAAEEYLTPAYDLMGWLTDLRIDAANTLVGSLFNRVVPQRQPIERNVIAIVTSDERRRGGLEHHFTTNTAVARAQRGAEQSLRARAEGQGVDPLDVLLAADREVRVE